MRWPRSHFWATTLPIAALLGGGARWLAQGSGNLYTATNHRYYLPDELLGWRVVHDGPVWLGLEVLAIVAAVAVAVTVAAWWLRRREQRGASVWAPLRPALWLVAAAPLAIPLWAWTSGLAPDGARDRLPIAEGVDLDVAPAGVSGSLAGAPAGQYEVVTGEGSAITARLVAGGESFDTRFAGDMGGALSLTTALSADLTGSVSVDAASVDTGVTGRSKHARKYLKETDFPKLQFRMTELLAAQQSQGPDVVEFWARGAIEMMDQSTPVTARGQARVLDEASRQRFGLQAPGLLVTANFSISLEETALADVAGDFDETDVPINATLLLVHRAGTPAGAPANDTRSNTAQ